MDKTLELEFKKSSMVSLRFFRSAKAAQGVHSPAERGLVRRLDTFLLTFGCISQGTSLFCNLYYAPRMSLTLKQLSSVPLFVQRRSTVSDTTRFLDQTNIQNAYVSGMKEDLHLYGNELN